MWQEYSQCTSPDPAPLPKARLQNTTPFTVTGVDFTGALYVRSDSTESKVYVCFFTCASSQALHLEVVTCLTEDCFLQAFRRFASRKSLPEKMISDNTSTYLSAAEELKRLFLLLPLKEAFSRSVDWQFIPKRAPWYGGFWERLIGLTKNALKKVLGRAYVDLVTLQTIITEIEEVLNDRPLTYWSSDVSDEEPLTLSHLLYGRRITALPYPVIDKEEINGPDYSSSEQLQRRACQQALLFQTFWHRWTHDYLTYLHEFHRTSGNNQQKIKIGDVVLVHYDFPR